MAQNGLCRSPDGSGPRGSAAGGRSVPGTTRTYTRKGTRRLGVDLSRKLTGGANPAHQRERTGDIGGRDRGSIRIHRAVERGGAFRGRSAEHPGALAACGKARRERHSDGAGRAGSDAHGGEGAGSRHGPDRRHRWRHRRQRNRRRAGRGVAHGRSESGPDRRPLHGDHGRRRCANRRGRAGICDV
jgi:hypothetical protein